MADIGILKFIAIIVGIATVGIIGYILYKTYWNKEDANNDDIIINLLHQYTGGHGLLVARKKEVSQDMVKITCLPYDLNLVKLERGDSEIKEHKLFVKRNLLIPMGNSFHRNIYLALPEDSESLTTELKNLELGNIFSEFIENKMAKGNEIEIQKLKEKNLLEMAKQTEGLDLAKEIINLKSEFLRSNINDISPRIEEKK